MAKFCMFKLAELFLFKSMTIGSPEPSVSKTSLNQTFILKANSRTRTVSKQNCFLIIIIIVITIVVIIIIIIIYSLTATVVVAPQKISQPVFSIFPCSPPPSGTCRTPGLSILKFRWIE